MHRSNPCRLRYAIALAVLFLLSGCTTTGTVAPTADNTSIVFGYIDMREAPSRLDHVTMRRLRPAGQPPYLFHVEDGVFFQLDVAPGIHKFERFGGSSVLKQTAYDYKFPNQGKGELLEIKRPGVYYVGSWRYKKIKSAGFFGGGGGEFDLERVDTPGERHVLEQVLADASHEHWKKMIRARLAELPSDAAK